MPVPVREIAIGVVGAVLIGGSLTFQALLASGDDSAAKYTTVCLDKYYSVADGCSRATSRMTQQEFGRAYVVTDAADRAGVDQYELQYRNAGGNVEQLGVVSLSTSKVPRYVLSLEDIDGRHHGPPRTGTYDLVTQSAGVQASYRFVIVAPSMSK